MTIHQIYADSAKLDWGTIPQPLDFIFIDGNHYYDYVKLDSKNALEHIDKNGCIVWHDYGQYPDVSKAVDEITDKATVVAIKGTRLAVATIRQKICFLHYQ